MKIMKLHYQHIETAFSFFLKNNPHFVKECRENGLNEKRIRWDISYLANLTPWICEKIYPYANDVHLDTAFKKVMRFYL